MWWVGIVAGAFLRARQLAQLSASLEPFQWGNATNFTNATNLTPSYEECLDLPNLGFAPGYTSSTSNGTHGTVSNITCSPGYLATRGELGVTVCNNGTWSLIRFENHAVWKPVDLNCQSERQLALLKEVVHYLDYTNQTWLDTDRRHFPFIDSLASQRRDNLKALQAASVKVINDTTMDIWPSEEDLQKLVNGLIENNFEPRGEPFTEAVCKNFANHTLYEYPPPPAPSGFSAYATSNVAPLSAEGRAEPWAKAVDWTCREAVQKTSTGWDFMNARPILFYRVGCYCESKLMLGCPNKYPVYQHFGFSSLEHKDLEPGGAITALCWYWSDPVHPEWGYLAPSDAGHTHDTDPRLTGPGSGITVAHVEAPAVNSSLLLR